MLIYFTDAVTQEQIAINPTYVTAVFVSQDVGHKGKTVISLTNGTLIVEQSQNDVVGALQAQL
jgi:hypothetical protein